MLFYFGYFLSKVALHFWGNPKKTLVIFSRTVKILFVCLLIFNIIAVLPYVIWYIKILFHLFSGTVNIEMSFPYVPGYNEIVSIFLSLMYKIPYIYILPGFCIGAFAIRA